MLVEPVIVRWVFARWVIVVSLACCATEVLADSSGSWWKTRDQRGVELLQSGDAAAASEVFKDSEWRGISHYRNGNFAEAQKEFAGSTDLNSLYNEGTAAARAGDYQAAVEKLEQVATADPAHADAQHNLDIARQLLEQQQQSDESEQGESEQGDEQDQQGESEENQAGEQDQQQGDQQQGDQQQGDQAGNEQSGQQQDGETSDDQKNSDGGGELSASAEDAQANEDNAAQSTEEQNQSEENPSEQQQAQQGQSEQDPSSTEAGESASAAGPEPIEPISESEQATEQWMRRIPDDPSQLLRNKIKLNHMIQHENVRDLVEPW